MIIIDEGFGSTLESKTSGLTYPVGDIWQDGSRIGKSLQCAVN